MQDKSYKIGILVLAFLSFRYRKVELQEQEELLNYSHHQPLLYYSMQVELAYKEALMVGSQAFLTSLVLPLCTLY